MQTKTIYTDGTYATNNPTWHEEDASFKAKFIAEIINKNNISINKVAEIGCGSGAIIKTLSHLLNREGVVWKGYDIAPEPIANAKRDPLPGIEFYCQDLLKLDETFDVLLAIDVFEHVPDYMGFLNLCRDKARYKIYHIPLDMHVSALLRDSLTNARKSVGHLHYFTLSTAIATLTDTGHKIIDTHLTPGAIALFWRHPSLKRAIANLPRIILSQFSPAFSTRLLGGHSLLVLAE
jgi:SAM-dependent methyltransferase